MDLSKLLGTKMVPPEKEGPPVSSGRLCRASRHQNGYCQCNPRVLCAGCSLGWEMLGRTSVTA